MSDSENQQEDVRPVEPSVGQNFSFEPVFCSPQKEITIEPVILKNRWRYGQKPAWINIDRRNFSKLGILAFYGSLTALIFIFFFSKLKDIPIASIYSAITVVFLSTAITTSFAAVHHM